MPRYGIWRLNSISGKKFEELTIEEKSKQVSSFLLQGLQQPGRTIRELDQNKLSGNDASSPIWHRLNEIRLFTAQKAGVSKIDPRKVRDNFGVGAEFDKIFDHEFLTLQNSGKLVFFNNIHTLFRLRDSFEDAPKDINIKNKSKLLKDEQLPLLDSEDIEKGFELISNELLMSKEKILEIIIALASGRHVLLAGPIGTGKTQLAKLIPKYFWKKWGGYFSEDHTATSDWSTLDVIGGIMPTMDGDKPKYVIQDGCVVDTVSKNWDDEGNRIPTENPDEDTSYRGTWLIIDEFNRADIDKAFGQLFTSLRTRELKIPTDEEDELFEKLKIPKDYRIIGTLNTADKHFLFNLSDALKSRFAYIEVDIPSRDESETEIYYALNNALKELELDESFEKIVLDHDGKKINKEQSDSDLYNRIQQAYVFLDTVRIFKKLGTAVLKLIYQNLIVGSQLSDNSLLSLDNALTSNLIPQLENLDSSKVGAIHALHSGGLMSFFKNAYDDLNKQSYLKPFENILDYLDIPEKSQLVSDFKKGNIPNDADFWKTLQVSYDEKKKDFEMELTQIKQALIELKNSRVI